MHLCSVGLTIIVVSLQVSLKSPVLRPLYGLPVCQRTDFKILLLVNEVLNDLKYISDLLLRYEPSRPLRSSGTRLLSVPRVKTKHGEAAFSFYDPHI